MYERILVALDGSPLAESILPYVTQLAEPLKLPVNLLHAIDPDSVSALADPDRGRHLDKVEEDLKARGAGYLSRIAVSLPESIRAECHVHMGAAAEVIEQYAAENEKTLLAMATHGHSGLKRMWLGSVTHKVLQVCANPMFLIRATEEAKPAQETTLSSIVVPLDGSAVAEKVLPHVIYIAKALRVRVTLFRVYALAPTMYAIAGYPSFEIEQKARDRSRQEIERYLSEKVDELAGQGLEDVEWVMVEGDAAAEITEIAETTKNNIVAMSTHGRSGVARWVLGSVTEKVVRQSGDAVLVVRS